MPQISRRKPAWLQVQLPGGDTHHDLKKRLRQGNLHTVCEEARCPNLGECWSSGTATIMILGEVCTRGCRFCSVSSGNPGGWLDPQEPDKCAEVVQAMNLNYVVVTCVDRDDLEDGGAGQFAAVIRAIHASKPDCFVEVLVSDYQGKRSSVETVMAAQPDVFAHNLETVESLTPNVRDPRAGYRQSLAVLAMAKEIEPDRIIKSSLMLGLGERNDQVREAMGHMRDAGVDVLTLGQYLQPSRKHLSVERFLPPEEFEELAEQARSMGFLYVAAGPLVRSSYKAGEFFMSNYLAKQRALALRGVMEV